MAKKKLAQHDRQENDSLIGVSDYICELREKIQYVAKKDDLNVFIEGPSGTGKELIAKSIHQKSNRKDKPFIPLNCAAINENLFESALFGHTKGSFTGAHQDNIGYLQAADGGTLFLDEVCEMPINQQAKLLRALQEQAFTRVGETGVHEIDIRVVAATNKTAIDQIKNGEFREDLYSRLKGLKLRTSNLIEAMEDLVCLARHLSTKNKIAVDPRSKFVLYSYSFPGNVRELENLLKIADNYEYFVETILDALSEHFGWNITDDVSSLKTWINALNATKWHNEASTENEILENALRYRKENHPPGNREILEVIKAISLTKLCDINWKFIINIYETSILLHSYTRLSKDKIAKLAKIQRSKLTLGGFQNKFGVSFNTLIDFIKMKSPIWFHGLVINGQDPMSFLRCLMELPAPLWINGRTVQINCPELDLI